MVGLNFPVSISMLHGAGARPLGLMVALLLVLLSLTSNSHADRLVLKNGKKIECVIVHEADSYLVVHTSECNLTVGRLLVQAVQRSGADENAILEGDEQFRRGKFDEAIWDYQKALESKPDEARKRIENAEKAMAERLARTMTPEESHAGSLTLEEQERDLREKLTQRSLPAETASSFRSQLTEVLLKRAQAASSRLQEGESTKLLVEAWKLSPMDPNVAVTLGRTLAMANESEKAARVLAPYLEQHADDLEALELYVRIVGGQDPWAVLRLLYPNGKLRPSLSQAMKDSLPGLLLTGFRSKKEPADAPFDRGGCYERLMELKPGTSPLPLLQYRVEANPDSVEALNALARYHMDKGAFPEAIRLLRKSVSFAGLSGTKELLARAQDRYIQAQQARADKFMDQNNPEEAQQVYEETLKTIPESKPTQDKLALVRRMGRCPTCNGIGQSLCAACQGRGIKEGEKPLEAVTYLNGYLYRDAKKPMCPTCRAPKGMPTTMEFIVAPGPWGEERAQQLWSQLQPAVLERPAGAIGKAKATKETGERSAEAGRGGSVSEAWLKDLDPDLPVHVYRCRICRKHLFTWPGAVEPGKDPGLAQSPEACPVCGGTGLANSCPTCGGKKLVQLAKPRKTSVDLLPSDQKGNDNKRVEALRP